MSFRGVIWGLNHSISQTDAQTTVTVSHAVFPVTEKFEIKSPLWQALLPTSQNPKGAQIVAELMEKVDGFQPGAAEQIPADTALFTDPATSDASAAAKYTGRTF